MNNILSEQDTLAALDILVEQLGVKREQLVSEAKIQADFSADSLTMIEIAMALEERFNLSISDEQWEEVVTVGDFLDVLGKALVSRSIQTKESAHREMVRATGFAPAQSASQAEMLTITSRP